MTLFPSKPELPTSINRVTQRRVNVAGGPKFAAHERTLLAVTRRLMFLAVLTLILSACGAADTSAIRLGESSISHEELSDLTQLAFPNGDANFGGIEPDAALNANLVRQVGGLWILLQSELAYQFRSHQIVLDVS